MIHDSLRTLPYVTCLDIVRTGNLDLLYYDRSAPKLEPEQLLSVWEPMQEKFRKLFNSQENNKIFNLGKEIEFLSNKHEIIVNTCDALSFDRNQQLIDLLHEYGYTFRDEQYMADLKRVMREAEGIKIRISQLNDLLPKRSADADEDDDTAITEQMASYAVFLGIDFDFLTVSVMKMYALQQQVRTKVKSLESNKPKTNRR